MLRHSQSILLPDGRTLYLQQLAEGESKDEFEGRALCEVENAVGKVRGTRWVRWDHYGHPLGSFNADSFGVLLEHTGEPYANRTRRLPGLFNEDEARRALGFGR